MKNTGIKFFGAFVLTAAVVGNVLANQDEHANEQIKAQLAQAKVILEKAQQDAEAIIRSAQKEAHQINKMNGIAHDEDRLYPLSVQNAKVSIEINAGSLQSIVEAIMPDGWRVLVDSKDPSIQDRRFQFVSTRTREQSLNDLLKPIGLKHQYFFELKDDSGKPSPLLIVSAQ